MVRAGLRTQGDCAYYAGRHARATSGGSHYLQAARTPGRCHPARSAMPRSADKPPAKPGKRRLLRARREVAVWNQIQEEGGCARVHDCTLGAAARTVVQRPTCAATTARQALAGVAALSATAKCAGRPPSRRAPMSAPLGVTGDEPPSMHLRLRSQSSCPTPVRRDHWRRPRGGALAAAGALVQRRPACTEWASHACSARRPSSTGSRFGTSMGAEQRAVRSGGAHPAGQPVAAKALRKSGFETL